ncbi:Protein ecm33 [Lachnellula hyalina]|uniref:Protein ecm33 n=1 Tax=Lachnellula hyalina TaxID=1316788 RepID=A0A8H8R6G8_9HELO|nr:Protein ecm33 [Lachnellula hyalina]TVY29444.1 Protein ecm33 [Lachnellula hyalina]
MSSGAYFGLARCVQYAAFAATMIVGIASGSEAQDVCTQDTYTITTQSDADALGSCNNITGLITVQSDTLTSLTLSGIQRLDGSLAISSCAALTEISAPQLQWINDNFTLSSLPQLTNLSLPALETVQMAISWISIPQLTSPSLKTEGVDEYGNPGTNIYGDLTISDTGIKTLDFFNFGSFSRVEDVSVTGNKDMKIVNLSSLVTSSLLEFADNGESFQILLPKLTTAEGLSLQDVMQFDISSLTTLSATLQLENNSFQAFEMDQLNAIGGDVIVRGNQMMNKFSLPALTEIGGGIYSGDFVIANNSALTALDGLGKLAAVDGSTNLSGNLYKVSLPAMDDMSDGFHLLTTVLEFNCSSFDRIFYSSDISKYPDRYSCGTSGTRTDTAIHYHPPSSGPAIPKATKVVIIIVCIVAALLATGIGLRWWAKRRRRGRVPEEPPISLRELGIAEEEGEGVDGLPPYRRTDWDTDSPSSAASKTEGDSGDGRGLAEHFYTVA